MAEWELMDLAGAISNAEGWLDEADEIASGFEGWKAIEPFREKIAEAKAALKEAMTEEIKEAVKSEGEEFDRQADMADGQSY